MNESASQYCLLFAGAPEHKPLYNTPARHSMPDYAVCFNATVTIPRDPGSYFPYRRSAPAHNVLRPYVIYSTEPTQPQAAS